MRRTGIDLSATGCVVVDVESSGRRRKGDASACRVHRFASIVGGDQGALAGELEALAHGSFSRRAWVNLWQVRSSHQYLRLPTASQGELERRARHHGASVLGLSDDEVSVATAIGGVRGESGHHPKTEVSFFAASSREIRDRLQPIIDAGFLVEGVTTPCGALWSQARLRRPSLPGEVHAHVALGPAQSALGIFADGMLLYGRDLDWGYAAPAVGVRHLLDRDTLAQHLAIELKRSFLYLKQYWEPDVSQVVLCGDMPEIRSLTAPLIERLNIEVETLDTLEGIDASTLPDGFAERAATFRLAAAIAVEPPPANLLPVDAGWIRTNRRAKGIAAGGTAAAVAFAAFLYAQADLRTRETEAQIAAIADPTPSDGPPLARAFDVLAHATSPEIAVTSVRTVTDGADWSVDIAAVVRGAHLDAARDRSTAFLKAITDSGVFTQSERPPVIRIDRGAVELAASYRVPKS